MSQSPVAAVLQMTSGADLDANLNMARNLLERARQQDAEIALLPENFAVFESGRLYEMALKEHSDAVFSRTLSEWARELDINIVAGTLPLLANAESQRVRAASLVFNRQGQQVARYDKIHLFDVAVNDAQGRYRESDHIEPGDKPVVVTLDGVSVGLSVCYDVRFPGLYQRLVSCGAEILTVPAAFTWRTGKAHWQILLQARAIETQCFVLAANQSGQNTPTRRTWGHSMIIDPWGEVLGECKEDGEGVCVTRLDMSRLQEIRQNMPILQHRVKSCYY